jgi:4-hydroxysphinganine ceramide fatty acyl 2-hydroxylase
MEDSKEFKVNHSGVNYNIFKFLNNHPGGINYVKPYEEKEVTQRMHQTQHSKAAYYLLREYRSGGRDTSSKADQEDLEALVDWDKPMLGQVANLGARYNEWVVSPVDRKLRLFCNPILESLTITPWYVVPLVWIPIILYFIVHGTRKYIQLTEDASPFLPTIFSLVSGIVLWTLIEYSLHRWVFHMEPSGKSKAMIYVHFAIHGLHHKVPFDPRRLVFPPVPAAVIAYAIYQICTLFVPESVIVLVIAGGLTGYVIYDMIHFYLHYGAPKEDSYFYHLKRYHNQHHFAHHDSGFGISSVFWDKIFGSAIKLRRLAMAIKW